MPLASLEEALEDIQQGKCLIVVDDERRENEGDLVMPAEMMTPESGQLHGDTCQGTPVYAHHRASGWMSWRCL